MTSRHALLSLRYARRLLALTRKPRPYRLRLLQIGARVSPEMMIERPVLHHQETRRVDRGVGGRGRMLPPRCADGLRRRPASRPRDQGSSTPRRAPRRNGGTASVHRPPLTERTLTIRSRQAPTQPTRSCCRTPPGGADEDESAPPEHAVNAAVREVAHQLAVAGEAQDEEQHHGQQRAVEHLDGDQPTHDGQARHERHRRAEDDERREQPVERRAGAGRRPLSRISTSSGSR